MPFPQFDPRPKPVVSRFGELLSFWRACQNEPPWETHVFDLFSRIAEHNIGAIDWEEIMPVFYDRIQRSLDLPVSFKGSPIGQDRE